MDDIQIILYIIFAAIAILSRVLSKKNKDAPPQSTGTDGQHEKKRPAPKSFEDLFREFTEEKDAPYRASEVIEEKSPEHNDDKIRETYNSSVKEAKKLKTIDELVDLEDDRHTGNFRHFTGYEEKGETQENEYLELLKDADGARKAIVLSEIFNRKY